jgi:hypothetical protein
MPYKIQKRYGMLFVATLQHLIKWLNDRRGIAAGCFGLFIGGGAMFCSYVNSLLLEVFGLNKVR